MKRRPEWILVVYLLASGGAETVRAQDQASTPTAIARQLLDLEQQAEAILQKLRPEERARVEGALKTLRARALEAARSASAPTDRPVRPSDALPATSETASQPGRERDGAGGEAANQENDTEAQESTETDSKLGTGTGSTLRSAETPARAEASTRRSSNPSRNAKDASESTAEVTAEAIAEIAAEATAEAGLTNSTAPTVPTARPSSPAATSPDVAAGSAPTCSPLIGLDSNEDGVLSGADRLWRHVYLTIDDASKDGVLSLFELNIRSVALDLRSFSTKGDAEGYVRRGQDFRFQLIGKIARKIPSGRLTLDASGIGRSGSLQLINSAGEKLDGFQILNPDHSLLWPDGTRTALGCSEG